MAEGFGQDEAVQALLAATADASGTDPAGPWVRFVGRSGGKPVASSGLLLFGGVAGIYNVATAPAARRQGFGTFMTRYAMRHARMLGYGVAILGASDLGRGIYERLGFSEMYRVHTYLLPR
jgi:ribosomal protein S18 acetylase RimI-like enzyme